MNFLNRLRRDEGGLATVEAAIALPVLFLVLFGIMEGGLFVLTKHQMDRATREGARYCSLYSTAHNADNTNKCIANNVNAIMIPILPSPDSPYFSRSDDFPVPSPPAQVDPDTGLTTVTVSVSGTFNPFTSLLPSLAANLSASTTVVPDW